MDAMIDPLQQFMRNRLKSIGAPTYVLGEMMERPCILCLVCTYLSFNPDDVKNKYCGQCHEFHLEGRVGTHGHEASHI
jgi:hypothetical protein